MVCKYRAYFHALFLIFLIFVHKNKADKSKKINQANQLTVRELQYAIEYVEEITNIWAK